MTCRQLFRRLSDLSRGRQHLGSLRLLLLRRPVPFQLVVLDLEAHRCTPVQLCHLLDRELCHVGRVALGCIGLGDLEPTIHLGVQLPELLVPHQPGRILLLLQHRNGR